MELHTRSDGGQKYPQKPYYVSGEKVGKKYHTHNVT